MIKWSKENNDNKEEIIKSNIDNPNYISEIEESRIGLIDENLCEKFNLNFQDGENFSIKKSKSKKINEVYKEKLIDMDEKEKDISVLVNFFFDNQSVKIIKSSK